MKFSNYETLTHLVLGYLLLMAMMFVFKYGYDNSMTVPYMAASYVIGYLLNAVSSLLEPIYYKSIGGMPSEKLLTEPKGNKKYTGIYKVRFYRTDDAIQKLKRDLNDENASRGKMFGTAMAYANTLKGSRVPAFNALYAFSREMLTLILIISILIIYNYPCIWESYLVLIAIAIAWNRYCERGYYYAKEVLVEYLNKQ